MILAARRAALGLTALLAAATVGASLADAADLSADRAFVAKVSQGGMFEVEAGKLAARRASAQDVRDFAAAEVHDHMIVGQRLKAAAGSAGITFKAELNADWSAKLDHLKSLSGAAFDQAYMNEMATLHDADGAAFAAEAQSGTPPRLRAMAAETHLIVQRHIGAIHGAQPS